MRCSLTTLMPSRAQLRQQPLRPFSVQLVKQTRSQRSMRVLVVAQAAVHLCRDPRHWHLTGPIPQVNICYSSPCVPKSTPPGICQSASDKNAWECLYILEALTDWARLLL